MNSMRLYDLADHYQHLLTELYDDETGEINEQALDKINELTDPIETKCINMVRLFKSLEAQQKAIEAERKAMAKREQAFKNQVVRLKDYLLDNMEKCKISKIECPQFVINLQKNPVALDIFDADQIPENYKKVIVDTDDPKIKEALQKGIEIPGARLVQRSSIRIR